MRVGDFITYQGKEYSITSVGRETVRLERGYGINHEILVVPITELVYER